MKTIFVPTDFSKTADNAMNYAVHLAVSSKASLTLFNCFHIPVITSDGPVITIPFEEIEKISIDDLNSRKKEIESKYPEIKVEVVSKAGFSSEEIIEYTQNNPIDLIVMGISGSGNFEQVLGSNATAVSKRSTVPVLIIPANASFKKPENIVMAFDFKEIKNTSSLNFILELTKQFNSKITALNVRQSHEVSQEQSLASKQANELLSDVPHTLVNYSDTDAISGIEHYLADHSADILVMLKRQHNFFDTLLHGSNTRKMAFHTHMPLLVLHD